MAFEAFGAAVDEGFEGLWVLEVDHVDERGVDPAARFDAIEAADDEFELHIIIFVFVLDLAVVRGDLDAGYSSFHE